MLVLCSLHILPSSTRPTINKCSGVSLKYPDKLFLVMDEFILVLNIVLLTFLNHRACVLKTILN